MKILIVEDNEKNRILLRVLLEHYGYETIEAVDGVQGIAMAKEHCPDLILLDIHMPVMDGIAALKVLKELPETKHIKVVALTSHAMQGDEETIFGAGADYYVSKPIDTRELPKFLRQLLT
jgi:CheY-like chemotaxis protein